MLAKMSTTKFLTLFVKLQKEMLMKETKKKANPITKITLPIGQRNLLIMLDQIL